MTKLPILYYKIFFKMKITNFGYDHFKIDMNKLWCVRWNFYISICKSLRRFIILSRMLSEGVYWIMYTEKNIRRKYANFCAYFVYDMQLVSKKDPWKFESRVCFTNIINRCEYFDTEKIEMESAENPAESQSFASM